MATNVNGYFKSVEVVGATKEEALAKAPFTTVMKDATQAYKNWKAKQNTVTEASKKQFMVDYTAKNSKNAPGVGFSITVEAAVADTRERPYTIEDVKNEKGKRKYKTIYKWIDDAEGTVVCTVDTTKKDAKDAIKKLYAAGEYKGNATLFMTKDVVEGEPIAAHAKYTPSKSSHNGTYLVFGIVND